MEAAAAASTEISVLGWSVLLLLAHIVFQSGMASRDAGSAYAAGNHEEEPELSPLAKRARNALRNFQETYPAFVALALALAVSGRTGGMAATGAWIWLAARVLYLFTYAAGIPVVRTLVFAASILGLALMFWRLMAG